jgi:hypothetical protein
MLSRLFYGHLHTISRRTYYQRELLIVQHVWRNFNLKLLLLLLLLIIWMPGAAGMSGIDNLRRILWITVWHIVLTLL